ncbi:PAS domain-containing protein [Trinickia dabaoshanensis]|uniref:PAS domain-containing protein n=1 Tax=Trinickia dabaoshanensis TaxID=564714 RepID=UPI001E2B8629|nr:PAS domain-containing protein [Trinickia dabaoshanensis]
MTVNDLLDHSGGAPVSVRLTPLQMSGSSAWDRMLVSFIREMDAPDALGPDGSSLLHDDLGLATGIDWEGEARMSREELDASPEELQALNEELKASNEQLNDSNEDLNRANAELQQNIAQLAMQNRVLLCGVVMAVFLDLDLKLRWFTPSMQDVFPLIPADVGRKIAELVPKFRDRDFYEHIQCVLHDGAPREAVIHDKHDRCFLRKIYPYLDAAGTIAGVAVTFDDIAAIALLSGRRLPNLAL